MISPTYPVLITNSHQFLKELDSPAPERTADARTVNHRVSNTRTVSSPNLLRTALLSERQPLLTRRRSFEDQADNEDAQKHTRVAGGTILGIHNLAIVFPQFIVSLYPIAPYDFYYYSSKYCNCIKCNIQTCRCGSSQRSYEHRSILRQERRCLDPPLWRTLHFGVLLCAPTSYILMMFWQLGAVLCRMVPLTHTERGNTRRRPGRDGGCSNRNRRLKPNSQLNFLLDFNCISNQSSHTHCCYKHAVRFLQSRNHLSTMKVVLCA